MNDCYRGSSWIWGTCRWFLEAWAKLGMTEPVRDKHEWETCVNSYFKAKVGNSSRPWDLPTVVHFQSKSCAAWPSPHLVPRLSPDLEQLEFFGSAALKPLESSSSYPFCPTRTDWLINVFILHKLYNACRTHQNNNYYHFTVGEWGASLLCSFPRCFLSPDPNSKHVLAWCSPQT